MCLSHIYAYIYIYYVDIYYVLHAQVYYVLRVRVHVVRVHAAGRNRQLMDDVGWNIYPGNYGNGLITQLKPLETSIGRWRVGPRDQHYGRFVRLNAFLNENQIMLRLLRSYSCNQIGTFLLSKLFSFLLMHTEYQKSKFLVVRPHIF